MQKLAHHSASVHFRLAPGTKYNVLEAFYSGPLTPAALDYFRSTYVELGQRSPVSIVRMDHALTLHEGLGVIAPNAGQHLQTRGAIIVRPDQWEVWSRYAYELARRHGVLRVVFLDAGRAYEWAERQARMLLHQSPGPLEHTQESCPSGSES